MLSSEANMEVGTFPAREELTMKRYFGTLFVMSVLVCQSLYAADPAENVNLNIPPNFEVDKTSSYTLQITSLYIDLMEIRQDGADAVVYADFDNDGDEDIFVGTPAGKASTADAQKRRPFEMYLNDGAGNFTLDLSLFVGDVPGAIVPRKALPGDFNGDGKPDVFILDHGYDGPPFPGAYPMLLLSSPKGLQYVGGLENYVGFHHGGASADIDADGDIDIFVTGPQFFLINDGQGNFTHNTDRLPRELVEGGLYTAELIDIDADGYVDLFAAATIYWGSHTGTYRASNKTLLPNAENGHIRWTICDIDAEDIDGDDDRDIVFNRAECGAYYVQVIVNEGGRQFTDQTSERIEDGSYLGIHSITWIRLQDFNGDGSIDIVVKDASRDLVWLNNGSGHFTLSHK